MFCGFDGLGLACSHIGFRCIKALLILLADIVPYVISRMLQREEEISQSFFSWILDISYIPPGTPSEKYVIPKNSTVQAYRVECRNYCTTTVQPYSTE